MDFCETSCECTSPWDRISLLLPFLPKVPSWCYSNGPGNLGNHSSSKEIRPEFWFLSISDNSNPPMGPVVLWQLFNAMKYFLVVGWMFFNLYIVIQSYPFDWQDNLLCCMLYLLNVSIIWLSIPYRLRLLPFWKGVVLCVCCSEPSVRSLGLMKA